MIRTYKYRLRPTKKQSHLLNKLFAQMQTVYNDALNERRWYWTRSRRSISYVHQWKRMRDERHARNDFWHKLTTQLVNTYHTIAVEKLNLSFMLRNGSLSLSAHDAALGRFFEMIDYKVAETGGQVIRMNPHNTSQSCSGCGQIVAKSLSVRVHRCDCGVELDRDVNAALNILYAAVGRTVEALTYPVADCVASEAPPLLRGECVTVYPPGLQSRQA